ncbi:MAG TPA: electron transfer flavoprotein subunit beta/FixA family protein [Ignavibacteria bacterium]
MKIAVCVSLVPDSTTKVKLSNDKLKIDKNGVTFIINPYDEFAVEEAVQLKEKHGGEVIAVSFGTIKSKDAIKKAYQMGADKGIFVEASGDFDSFTAAKNLAETIKDLNADIIFFGKQSIDYDSSVIPAMVGEILNLPYINVVTKLDIDGTIIRVEREIEGGKEILESTMPVIIGAQKGLNNPRYPNLRSIMASKSKPVEEKKASYTGNITEVTEMSLPAIKGTGKILKNGVSDVPELVKLLREEAKVI